jgi:N-acetyl-gamma-glutamylphosphate reductase
MTPKVYIDGQHCTAGLHIRELLAARDDVAVLEIAGGCPPRRSHAPSAVRIGGINGPVSRQAT